MTKLHLSPPVPLSPAAFLTLAPIPAQTATVGVAFNLQPVASGGTVPYNWTETDLPAPLVLNASTGQVTGTPTAVNSELVTIILHDSAGNSAPQSFTLNVVAAPPNTPTVTALSVYSGSPSGGATVVLTGTNFTGVTAVKYGTTPAASYTVNSSTQITTTSPAEAAGTVNVTVTTASGTSGTESANQFTFTNTSFATGLSANTRYTVDQFGSPWLMVGDSVWSLMSQLSVAQMQTYFSERQSLGFNAALVSVISTPYSGMNSNSNSDEFATYDGVTPFTIPPSTANWLASPNPAYFQRVLAMVELAASYGITVFLDPYETGYLVNQQPGLTTNNSTAVCTAYGQYLGKYFKAQPNVVWSAGNDYALWATYDPWVLAISEGIASVASSQLQTVEILATTSSVTQTPNLSTDDPAWPAAFPSTFINGVYTYWSAYDVALRGYNRTPTLPVFMAESDYEGNNNAEQSPAPNEQSLRGQNYWTMTCGGTGALWGNANLWYFNGGLASLSTTGATQFGYFASLFKAIGWWKLVPDQSHVFLTAGYGTDGGQYADPAADSYCTGAVSADGTVGAVYAPQGATLTINMAKMVGTTTARWYDPTLGTFTAISSLPNVGTHPFVTPTAAHGDGSHDWVLVLTATASTPAPTVTGLSPTSGSSAGGTHITVTGTNFTGAEQLLFGSTSVSFTLVSSTSITAITPAGTAGVTNVRVVTPSGESPTGAANQFTYTAAPSGLNPPTIGQAWSGDANYVVQSNPVVMNSTTAPPSWAPYGSEVLPPFGWIDPSHAVFTSSGMELLGYVDTAKSGSYGGSTGVGGSFTGDSTQVVAVGTDGYSSGGYSICFQCPSPAAGTWQGMSWVPIAFPETFDGTEGEWDMFEGQPFGENGGQGNNLYNQGIHLHGMGAFYAGDGSYDFCWAGPSTPAWPGQDDGVDHIGNANWAVGSFPSWADGQPHVMTCLVDATNGYRQWIDGELYNHVPIGAGVLTYNGASDNGAVPKTVGTILAFNFQDAVNGAANSNIPESAPCEVLVKWVATYKYVPTA